MSFYNDLQATAAKLLISKGAACTLRKQTTGAYNPSFGSATITTTDYSIVGVLLNYTFSQINSDSTLIEATDRKAIIQGTVTPDTSDLFIFGGVTYRIVAIKTVNPNGTALIHEMQIRI